MKKQLSTFITLFILIAGCANDDHWDDSVIPVTLKDIEAVNIDNSGEYPIISGSEVKKEAYMIGVKWITDNTPTEDDDKFVTGPIEKGEQTYNSLGDKYSVAILSNSQFNVDIPAGKYISKYFKEIDRNYLPKDIDEGFVLLVAPDPGKHSFRVEYYEGEELKFFHETETIKFY